MKVGKYFAWAESAISDNNKKTKTVGIEVVCPQSRVLNAVSSTSSVLIVP